MIKDILISALYMLNLSREAEEAAATQSGSNETLKRFLRFFNLVNSEIASEYRTDSEAKKEYGLYDDEPAYYGITPRILAYGVAAEYCITEGLEDAATWDKRYKDGIANAKRKSAAVKCRKFF